MVSIIFSVPLDQHFWSRWHILTLESGWWQWILDLGLGTTLCYWCCCSISQPFYVNICQLVLVWSRGRILQQTYWAISYCWNLCNSCQSPQPLPDISPVIADILEFSITSRILIISYEVMKIIWHLSPVSIHYLWVDKGCVWLQSAGSPFHHFRILVSLLLNRFNSWSLETKKRVSDQNMISLK